MSCAEVPHLLVFKILSDRITATADGKATIHSSGTADVWEIATGVRSVSLLQSVPTSAYDYAFRTEFSPDGLWILAYRQRGFDSGTLIQAGHWPARGAALETWNQHHCLGAIQPGR